MQTPNPTVNATGPTVAGSNAAEKQSKPALRLEQRGYFDYFNGEKAPQEEGYGLSSSVACIIRYALWRLRRSDGAPVSINQSAMAAFFARERQKGQRGDRKMCFGPALRTISRSWTPVLIHLNSLGFRAVRVHSPGVSINGKRPKRARQSKLGWVVYSQAWEQAGNNILAYMERSPKHGKTRGKVRSRWVRNEVRSLVSDSPNFAVHYAINPVNALSSGEQRQLQKQVAPTGPTAKAAKHAVRTDEEIAFSTELRRKHSSWRMPPWAARKIWAISRRYLKKEGQPVAYRAMDLWHAAFDARQLFQALERATDWAKEAKSGHRGKIAAAVFAGLVMKVSDPFHAPPTNESFWQWIQQNADSWRTETARRVKEYCVQKIRDGGHDPEVFVQTMRAELRKLEQEYLKESTLPSGPNAI